MLPDCAPARTILVEHDITYDLYAQMLAHRKRRLGDPPPARAVDQFETAAWRQVDRVVTMSEKDRGAGARSSGDSQRRRPGPFPAVVCTQPDPRRLLFIGSFAHRPNVMALEFFLRDVFPRLDNVTLHVIAGQRHERFWDLQHPEASRSKDSSRMCARRTSGRPW